MAKAIRFTYEGVDYELQFTKRTVREMEMGGFKFREVPDKPMTLLPQLFKGAFLANHRKTNEATINAIYESLPNKGELMDALFALYDEPISALMAEPSEENPNVTWTLS